MTKTANNKNVKLSYRGRVLSVVVCTEERLHHFINEAKLHGLTVEISGTPGLALSEELHAMGVVDVNTPGIEYARTESAQNGRGVVLVVGMPAGEYRVNCDRLKSAFVEYKRVRQVCIARAINKAEISRLVSATEIAAMRGGFATAKAGA